MRLARGRSLSLPAARALTYNNNVAGAHADPHFGGIGRFTIGARSLPHAAACHVATLKRIEGSAEISGTAETIRKIQRALEAAGLQFIPDGGGKGPGVGLSQSQEKKG
jgi:hypothetical protein